MSSDRVCNRSTGVCRCAATATAGGLRNAGTGVCPTGASLLRPTGSGLLRATATSACLLRAARPGGGLLDASRDDARDSRDRGQNQN